MVRRLEVSKELEVFALDAHFFCSTFFFLSFKALGLLDTELSTASESATDWQTMEYRMI